MLPQSAPATPLDKNAQDFRRPLPAGEIAAIPIVGGLHHQYVRREVKSMLSARRAGTIAVIGAGEMGTAVAHQMLSKGARVLTTLKGRSAASAERVRLAGIEVVDDDDAIALEAGFLLSIVPPGQAIAVARRFHGPLARAAKKPVFVECNAISPATMRRIADALESSGCKLVDAGIIGGPPRTDRPDEGPRLYASGQHAQLVSDLGKFGLDVQIVDGPIGAASALKMSYAGLTKGLIAIGAAMVAGARRAGLSEALRAELERTQPELLRMLRARVPAMFPKAYRWVAEMEQIGEFLGSTEDGAAIYAGIARLYEQIATEWEKAGASSASFTAITALDGPST